MELKSWDALTRREQEQVGRIFVSLQEFSYGFDRTSELWLIAEELAPAQRFYATALYQYAVNLYLVESQDTLRRILPETGCRDLLDPIERLLETPLGDTSLGAILRQFRDKYIVHSNFTFRPVERAIYSDFDLQDQENAGYFGFLLHRLFFRTKVPYVSLFSRFRELMLGSREVGVGADQRDGGFEAGVREHTKGLAVSYEAAARELDGADWREYVRDAERLIHALRGVDDTRP